MNTIKLAWVRDQSVPEGQLALGTFKCTCGVQSPPRRLLSCEGDWHCPNQLCSRVWTWRGWLVAPPPLVCNENVVD
jgi:hypothetical protein